MNKKLSYKELQNKVSEIQGELALKSEEVNKLKYSFLANVSHEIRTPMNVIVGFTNLLNDPNYDQDQKSFFIDEINKNSRQLLRLIDNIIHTAKLESDNIKMNMDYCSVNEILDELYFDFLNHNEYSAKKGLTIQLNRKDYSKVDKIFTDSAKLKRVLSNLIESTIKDTSFNTIEFGYNFSDQRSIEFFVKDIELELNGQNVENLKNMYNQSQDDELFNENVMGTGLAITDKLIRLLGGKLTVKSTLGKGSSFNFTIPLLVEKSV